MASPVPLRSFASGILAESDESFAAATAYFIGEQ
jgi:hypothetical protein